MEEAQASESPPRRRAVLVPAIGWTVALGLGAAAVAVYVHPGLPKQLQAKLLARHGQAVEIPVPPPAPLVAPTPPPPPEAPVAAMPVLQSAPPAPEAVAASAPTPASAPPAQAEPPVSTQAIQTLDAALKSQAEEIEHLKSQQERTLGLLVRMSAYDHLKDAMQGGRPFAAELAAVRAKAPAPASAPLETLASYASHGMLSREALKAHFAQALPFALHPPLPKDAGVLERMKHELAELVTIRPVGPQQGDTPEAIISRAEAALEAGSLADAVAEIHRLQGPTADAFVPWLADAEGRLAQEKALAQLHDALLADAVF